MRRLAAGAAPTPHSLAGPQPVQGRAAHDEVMGRCFLGLAPDGGDR